MTHATEGFAQPMNFAKLKNQSIGFCKIDFSSNNGVNCVKKKIQRI